MGAHGFSQHGAYMPAARANLRYAALTPEGGAYITPPPPRSFTHHELGAVLLMLLVLRERMHIQRVVLQQGRGKKGGRLRNVACGQAAVIAACRVRAAAGK